MSNRRYVLVGIRSDSHVLRRIADEVPQAGVRKIGAGRLWTGCLSGTTRGLLGADIVEVSGDRAFGLRHASVGQRWVVDDRLVTSQEGVDPNRLLGEQRRCVEDDLVRDWKDREPRLAG